MRIVPVPSQWMHWGRCWSASRRPGFLPVPEQRRQVCEVWFMVILWVILWGKPRESTHQANPPKAYAA